MILKEIEKCNIGDVLRSVLASHERTTFAIDDNSKLVGVFSEGDLLRLLWKGVDIESPASAYLNHNPFFILESSTNKNKEAINLFIKHGLVLVPVIDSERKLIEVLSIRTIISGSF
jgi:CBS domain-containing protein